MKIASFKNDEGRIFFGKMYAAAPGTPPQRIMTKKNRLENFLAPPCPGETLRREILTNLPS